MGRHVCLWCLHILAWLIDEQAEDFWETLTQQVTCSSRVLSDSVRKVPDRCVQAGATLPIVQQDLAVHVVLPHHISLHKHEAKGSRPQQVALVT